MCVLGVRTAAMPAVHLDSSYILVDVLSAGHATRLVWFLSY